MNDLMSSAGFWIGVGGFVLTAVTVVLWFNPTRSRLQVVLEQAGFGPSGVVEMSYNGEQLSRPVLLTIRVRHFYGPDLTKAKQEEQPLTFEVTGPRVMFVLPSGVPCETAETHQKDDVTWVSTVSMLPRTLRRRQKLDVALLADGEGDAVLSSVETPPDSTWGEPRAVRPFVWALLAVPLAFIVAVWTRSGFWQTVFAYLILAFWGGFAIAGAWSAVKWRPRRRR